MPICQKCNKKFPHFVFIDGKKRSIRRRKHCLECSPFNSHKSREKYKTDVQPTCSKCGKTGQEYFYPPKEGVTYSWCKECDNEESKKRQKKRKELAVEYKGGKCQCCGYDKYIGALEFHHLDPNEKDQSIRFRTCPLEQLYNELDKCIMVCGNCHGELHDGLLNIDEFL